MYKIYNAKKYIMYIRTTDCSFTCFRNYLCYALFNSSCYYIRTTRYDNYFPDYYKR